MIFKYNTFRCGLSAGSESIILYVISNPLNISYVNKKSGKILGLGKLPIGGIDYRLCLKKRKLNIAFLLQFAIAISAA